jgi:hypothetical protein
MRGVARVAATYAVIVSLSAADVFAQAAAPARTILAIHPKLTPAAYGDQKRREAQAVGAALGAEVIVAPYKDGELPDDDATRRYVADVIRQVKRSRSTRSASVG